MNKNAGQPSDGLEWLRAIHRDLHTMIGLDARARAVWYQAKERGLRRA